MGDHYLPQMYLRGFCLPAKPVQIAMFVRDDRKWITTNIRNVAQENGLYSSEAERRLALEVDAPGHQVLSRIRNGEWPDSDDKRTLALYLMCLFKRVPRSKERLAGLLPGAAANVFREIQAELNERDRVAPDEASRRRIAMLRAELERRRIALASEFPEDIWRTLVFPETAPRAAGALAGC